MSTLSAFPFIGEQSFATPGAINSPLSIISANIAAVNAAAGAVSGVTITPPSGNTITIASDLSVLGTIASGPHRIGVSSNVTNYLFLSDTSNARSNYIIGSQVGGTADGLNIWDASGSTMLVSFSKQSIRFYQNVTGPVFDVGGALASTLNAATFGTGADSKESRIQAAISAASLAGISRVYLPASMYPYSAGSVSFDSRVQMVREGGIWTVHDVFAYGAKGDFVQDDTAAINAAISNASNSGGGVVYLPAGDYLISAPLVFGPTLTNQITFTGVGRRDVTIRPTASVHTAILVGAVNRKTQYGRFVDFTVYGTDTSNHSGTGIHMIHTTQFSVDRVNIEGFTQGSGLVLQGQAVSTGSEAVRNIFTQLLIATCQRPLYLRNADENEFYSLIAGLVTGSTSSVTCIEINQGRNNRFYGLLMQGETSSLTTGRPNYIGFYCSNPLTANGDNQGHSIYGGVAEGFERGLVIPNSGISRILVLQYNASICSLDLADSGASTCVISPMAGRFHVPDGFSTIPSPGYSSEESLGFYRSNNSVIAMSYGQFAVVGGTANQPGLTFTSNKSMGLIDNGDPGMDFIVTGATQARLDTGQLLTLSGSAVLPSKAFTSEKSLGWYRSAASQMALSYGAIVAPSGAFSDNFPVYTFSSNKSLGLVDNSAGIDVVMNGTVAGRGVVNQWLTVSGSALAPSKAFTSELSLGLYRSGVSTIAPSYGTFNLATNAVRLSMRTAASLDSTTLAVDEVAFSIQPGSSGASLAIRSGGTIFYFASSNSTKAP